MSDTLKALQALTKALDTQSQMLQNLVALQTKGVTGTPTAQSIHGPGGLFSVAGIDDVVINAHLMPVGIDSLLKAFPTTDTNPLFPFLTGFEPDGSSEPSGPCENCPGGVMESCITTAVFGRICRESQEIDINQVMLKLNRGETTPLRLLGEVLGDSRLIPRNLDRREWIELVTQAQMVTTGIELQRAISPMIWTGNPANNVGTGYMEFPGFDIQISNGYSDAITSVSCESLDSDLKDFDYNDVCGNNPDIVETMAAMAYYLSHVARGTGLVPTEWVIAMRPQLFFELTACWPCKYLTNRCLTTYGAQAGGVAVINDDNNTRMRDEMRTGSYLLINGEKWPVVLDDGIFESNSENSDEVQAGQFASDIYFIPLRARGRTVTYFEFLDYGKARPDEAVLRGRQDWWSTDGGMYHWTMEQRMWCFVFAAKIQPRLILRTPHLAGRVMNVRYSPLQHLRSPWPDDPYFVKGGVEVRDTPSYYTLWS